MSMPLSRPRRGVAVLEFALVVPGLVLLMLGIMEFGWYARNQLNLANATREGARAASIGLTQDDVKTRIINAATIPVATGDITLQYSSNSGGSYSAFPGDNNAKTPPQNGVPAGSLVRVTVNVANRRLLGFPITPARLNVSVSMVRERS